MIKVKSDDMKDGFYEELGCVTLTNYIQNVIWYSSCKFSSICIQNYWGLSVQTLT